MATAADLLDQLTTEVASNHTVDGSAVTFIQGVPGLIAAAVAEATKNGATEAQLAPLQALIDDIKASSTAVAAAITANTSAAPSAPSARR